jgi:hypothetical protein
MASTTFTDGITPVPASWLNDVNTVTYTGTFFSNGAFGTGARLTGAVAPALSVSNGVNNYTQVYIYNPTNGTSASADFAAYANNSTATSGFVDIGFSSQTYADASYTVTGANEAYILGSAPSGSGKTGNLVVATDSTGTANAIQFYTGGFNQLKTAWKMQIDSSGVNAPALVTTTQSPGDNSTKVATTAFVTAAVAGGGSYVTLTGNQTIAGIKTFTSQPVFPVQSMIRVNTANGFGTTDTRIRRFSNITNGVNGAVIQGSDITVSDTAANGTVFTIVTSGVYSISYSVDWTPAGTGGLSLNSTELTTDLTGVTNLGSRIAIGGSAGSQPTVVSWTGYLVAGDKIRPHTDGTGAAQANRNTLTITRVS